MWIESGIGASIFLMVIWLDKIETEEATEERKSLLETKQPKCCWPNKIPREINAEPELNALSTLFRVQAFCLAQ